MTDKQTALDVLTDPLAQQLRSVPMARITVRPRWAKVLDFVTRLPSSLSAS